TWVTGQNVDFALANAYFDAGMYSECIQVLAKMDLESPEDFRSLLGQVFRLSLAGQSHSGDAAMEKVALANLAFGLGGQVEEAAEITENSLANIARLRRYVDLLAKTPIYPNDNGLAQAIASVQNLNENVPSLRPAVDSAPVEIAAMDGFELYKDACANCHGLSGRGDGRSARHLFPPPRNLVSDQLRYVTGKDGKATSADIQRTLRQGLHGVSMPGYQDLDESQILQLSQIVEEFQASGGHLITQETEKPVDLELTPNAIAGEKAFAKLGCAACHPVSKAPPAFTLSNGDTIRSRDLAKDFLRGGDDREALSYRIQLGIPGTPHPALAAEDQVVVNLIDYILSLRLEPPRPSTNFERRRHALGLEESPGQIGETSETTD
ncbi:MAG: c-type cytochrome, partial [Planctomycetota bacterium]